MIKFRLNLSKSVTLPSFNRSTNLRIWRQQLAGSLAGAAPRRKNICGAQRQAHPGRKSGVECKGKSLSDCALNSKKRRNESWA